MKKDYNFGLKENDVTPEKLFNNRRNFLKLGAASIVASATVMELLAKEDIPLPKLSYLKDANKDSLELTSYKDITNYNNYYEYSTSKKGIGSLAKNFKTNPWSIKIDGLIEKDLEVDLEQLIKKFSLEERIYRFRCVEGWSMVVPWVGFELSKLIKKSAVSPSLLKVFTEFFRGDFVSPSMVTFKSIGSVELIFLTLNLVLFIFRGSISLETTTSNDFEVTPLFRSSSR